MYWDCKLQIVDPDMKILNINARYPGARNDAYIWSAFAIRRVMEYNYNHGERRTYLIGKNDFNKLRIMCTFYFDNVVFYFSIIINELKYL